MKGSIRGSDASNPPAEHDASNGELSSPRPGSMTGPAIPAPVGRVVPRWAVFSALVVLFVFWSNSFHAISYLRRDLDLSALATVAMRFGPAVPFCVVYCLLKWKDLVRMMRRDWWAVLIMGGLMVPGYNLSLNWGQGLVPPPTASLIIAANPVFILILSALLLHDRPRFTQILGMAVSFLGIYLLIRSQHREFGDVYLPYALVVVLAPLSWALATVLGKPATARSDPLLLTFAATALGSIPFLGLLIFNTGGSFDAMLALDTTGWISILHLTVLCTIVGFAIWFWALRRLPASTVAGFVFLNPPFTFFFGALWGTSEMRLTTALFGLLTLAGVAISTGRISLRRSARTDRTLPLPPD